MVEKERKKSNLGNLLSKYGTSLMLALVGTVVENIDDLPKKISNLLHIRKLAVKMIVTTMLAVAAILLILYGLSMFIDSFFPGMRDGLASMIVGGILLIIIYIYSKYF